MKGYLCKVNQKSWNSGDRPKNIVKDLPQSLYFLHNLVKALRCYIYRKREKLSMKLFRLIFLLRFRQVYERIFLHEEGAMRAS